MYDKEELDSLEEGWFFYDHAWLLLHHILKNIKGNSLLDVGCGSGMALAIIKAAKPHLTVKGIDPSSEAVAIWQQRNIDAIVGEAEKLPYKDRTFDTVVSSHVIEHIEDHLLAVKEIVRVSRKRSIIIVPSGNVDEKNLGSPHLRYYDRKSFSNLIAQCTNSYALYCYPHHHMDNLIAIIEK